LASCACTDAVRLLLLAFCGCRGASGLLIPVLLGANAQLGQTALTLDVSQSIGKADDLKQIDEALTRFIAKQGTVPLSGSRAIFLLQHFVLRRRGRRFWLGRWRRLGVWSCWRGCWCWRGLGRGLCCEA
jgi:hypothetical protein